LPHDRGKSRRSSAHIEEQETSMASAHGKENPRGLRIMTYNVHSCVGLDGKLAPTRIARIIRSFDPDIVALQEMDLKRARSKGEDQPGRLARELGMQRAFCCTANRAWEQYGHGLLARFPIEVIASGLYAGEEKLEEPRGAMLAKIQSEAGDIFVVN